MSYQIITFKVSDQVYGLQMNQIKEVVVKPQITPIPLSPSYIEGVANVRGEVLAIINLEKKFELETKNNLKKGFILVIASEDIKVGIFSPDIPDTLSVLEENINWQPDIITQAEDGNYIEAIIKSKDEIIILIDIFKLFSEETVKNIT